MTLLRIHSHYSDSVDYHESYSRYCQVRVSPLPQPPSITKPRIMLRGFLILHLESADGNGAGLLGRHIPGSHDESAKRTIPCVPRGTVPCVMS